MKSLFIPGTRPEIIKMSPVIRECKEAMLESFTQHTGRQISLRKDRARARSGPGGGRGVFCAGWVLERCGDVREFVEGGDDSE